MEESAPITTSNNKYNKYWKFMSHEVREAPDNIKRQWIKWYKLKESNNTDPDGYIRWSNDMDEEIVVSCKGIWKNSAKVLRRNGAPESIIEQGKLQSTRMKQKSQLQGSAKTVLNKMLNDFYGKTKKKSLLGLKEIEVLEMFGKWYNIEDVHNVIIREWHLPIQLGELKTFYKENIEKIEYLRTKYSKRKDQFHIATDTGRMEGISALYMYWRQAFNECPTIQVSQEMRKLIELAKKEVKGDEIVINLNGNIDVEATMQANRTIDDVLSKLPINLMVIGLVAAKANVNPVNIMASLTNSYYKNYNGFNKLDNKNQAPSMKKYIEAYSWENLVKTIDDTDREGTFSEYEEVTEQEEANFEEDKQSALELLNRYKTLDGK